MTPEDRQEVFEIIESFFLQIPKLVASMYAEEIQKNKLKLKFFEDNKEFSNHMNIVGKTIEEVDSKNPGISYDRILDLSIPLIKKRIEDISSLDLTTNEKPKDLSYHGII
jgi:hypothetical protein